MSKEIIFKGEKFESATDLCNKLNFPYSAFQNRIRKGMSIEEALLTPLKKDKYKTKKHEDIVYDHLGNEYSSFKEMCDHYGLPEKLVEGRLRCHGWELKDALTRKKGQKKPPRQEVAERGHMWERFPWMFTGNKKEVIDHEGNTFRNMSQMCECYGISTGAFNGRMNKLNPQTASFSDLKEILESPMRKRSMQVVIGDKVFPSVAAFCEVTHISDEQYFYLKKSGQMDVLEKIVA